MQWLIKHRAEDFPPPYSTLHSHALLHLKSNELVLFNWATEKAFLKYYDIEHDNFKPDYNKPDIKIDLVSLQKQIASSE